MRFKGLLAGYNTNVEHLAMGHIDNLDGVCCICLFDARQQGVQNVGSELASTCPQGKRSILFHDRTTLDPACTIVTVFECRLFFDGGF